jgi:hypothetical protein
MSGRKYSQVALQNNIREALHTRAAAEEMCQYAESVVEALGEQVEKAGALQPLAEASRQTLSQVRQELGEIEKQLSQSPLHRLDIAKVRRHRDKLSALQGELDAVVQKCRAGEVAAAQRAELAAICHRWENNRQELEPWLQDVYENFSKAVQGALRSADEEIRTSGKMSTTAPRIADLDRRYKSMLAKASERRKQDAERHYIADSLENVCKEMGFTAEQLPGKSVLEDVIVRVNTYAYGEIDFHLELDGTIRSQSEMRETSCHTHYGEIEDKLKSLGVVSKFRFEADQRPVRLEKGAKSLSGDEPAPGKAIAGGHG